MRILAVKTYEAFRLAGVKDEDAKAAAEETGEVFVGVRNSQESLVTIRWVLALLVSVVFAGFAAVLSLLLRLQGS